MLGHRPTNEISTTYEISALPKGEIRENQVVLARPWDNFKQANKMYRESSGMLFCEGENLRIHCGFPI